ncbi:MAG TPA: hypothetical protein PLA50_20175, partial [Bacteroidia bacterium]|nr:hypothetical protein [Bacteroidia bacterium]
VHFHIPIHVAPEDGFGDTRDHLRGTLDYVAANPSVCRHFEMETYTWEVMPPSLRAGEVVDQLAAEYGWCLGEFGHVGLR